MRCRCITLASLPTIICAFVPPFPVRSSMRRASAASIAIARHASASRSIPSIRAFATPPPARPSLSATRTCATIMMASSSSNESLQYIDAGANLLDSMYQGTYHSKPRHEPDLDIVLRRAYEKGVHKVISLAGTIKESEQLVDLIQKLDIEATETAESSVEGSVQVFGTVGVHPTRCAEVFAEKNEGGDDSDAPSSSSWIPKTERQQDEIIERLIDLAAKGKESGNVVAIGECGLDYARLQFCPKDIQQLGLRAQLEVARETGLPLYLHNRESGEDLYHILSEYKDRFSVDGGGLRGIVHSFDESIEIADKFLSLGLYIGINGCSLKTKDNLEVAKRLPLERLILETDCPWCDIRATHAGSDFVTTTFATKKEKQYTRELGKEYCVKNRTEPCHIAQVAEVVAGVRGADVREVVDVCRRNVYDLFGSLEKKR